MDRNMIDATSGEALVDKTPKATRNLITKMATNLSSLALDLIMPLKELMKCIFLLLLLLIFKGWNKEWMN